MMPAAVPDEAAVVGCIPTVLDDTAPLQDAATGDVPCKLVDCQRPI